MGRYFDFWGRCFQWAYWKWEGREPILAWAIPLISLVATVGGLGGLVSLLHKGINYGWITLIPLGILILFIAPYWVWKSDNDKLKDLTTLRLKVEVEPEETSVLPDGEVSYWRHLIVRNPTGKRISGCYCKIVDFRSNTEVSLELPKRGIRYPWSTRGGPALNRTTVDIAGGSFDIADIAVCKSNEPNEFRTPIPSHDQYRRCLEYPLPPGTYEVDIEVGSDSLDFKPTLITLAIKFSGGFDLKVDDITDRQDSHS